MAPLGCSYGFLVSGRDRGPTEGPAAMRSEIRISREHQVWSLLGGSGAISSSGAPVAKFVPMKRVAVPLRRELDSELTRNPIGEGVV
jgi:hypothetical protein